MPRASLPLQTRAAETVPASIDAENHTVDVVFTTGAAVERYDWWRDRYYSEELVVSEEAIVLDRLRNGAPALNSHQRYDLDSIIGVVEEAWIEGERGLARVRLHHGNAAADDLWTKISSGIIRNISVGYRYHELMELRDGETITYRITKWEPTEISFVAVGADAGAGVRSGHAARQFPCTILERESSDMAETSGKASGGETPADTGTEAPEQAAQAEGLQGQAPEGERAPPDSAKADAQREGSAVSEILDLCATAGLETRTAHAFIKEGRTVGEVRAYIEGTRNAALHEGDEITGTRAQEDAVSAPKINHAEALRHWAGPAGKEG